MSSTTASTTTTARTVTLKVTDSMLERNTQAISAEIDASARADDMKLYKITTASGLSGILRIGDTHMIWGTKKHTKTPEQVAFFTALRAEVVASPKQRIEAVVEFVG
jgi:hypothetical protein